MYSSMDLGVRRVKGRPLIFSDFSSVSRVPIFLGVSTLPLPSLSPPRSGRTMSTPLQERHETEAVLLLSHGKPAAPHLDLAFFSPLRPVCCFRFSKSVLTLIFYALSVSLSNNKRPSNRFKLEFAFRLSVDLCRLLSTTS